MTLTPLSDMERGFCVEMLSLRGEFLREGCGFCGRQVEEKDINRGSYLLLGDANDGKCRVHKCRRDELKRQIGCGDE